MPPTSDLEKMLSKVMCSPVRFVTSMDHSPLNDLLMDGKTMRLVSAEAIKRFPHVMLQGWCKDNARYSVPTSELIAWLKEKIGGRTAIELAAGMGDTGRLLGITPTDSYLQTDNPAVREHYALLGQPIIQPPPDVLKYEAIAAVEHFKPQVALGCFLTQKFQKGDTEKHIGSNFYGPDEFEIIKQVETYIFVGNEGPHHDKRILSLPHETYKFPWLVSRGADQSKNVIWVWNRS